MFTTSYNRKALSNERLDNDMLLRMAPSIFAKAPSLGVSEKYTFVPTIEVVDSLKKEGWFPVHASQTRAIKKDKIEFSKHMLRFRRENFTDYSKVGDSLPELVLVNSHDGGTAFQLHGGLFRLACSNGMVVSDGCFEHIAVKHIGFKKDDIIEASYRVLEAVPQLMGSVDAMRSIVLNPQEQRILAKSALTVRYGEPSEENIIPVEPDSIIRPRRWEDRPNTLWETTNVIQEHLLRGGVRGWNAKKRSRITTKPISAIDKNISLNKALWELAESMKALKLGAVA